MSEARSMTSGEEARTIRRNSLRASLSPASAFSETALSLVRRSLVSSESSSAPGVCPALSLAFASSTSVLSFVSVVSSCYQVGVGKDLCCLRQLEDRCDKRLQALQLRLLPFPLRLLKLPLRAVFLCDDLREWAGSYVFAQYAPILRASPAAGVVAPPAFSSLPCHGASYNLLQSRGGRRYVTQRRGAARWGQRGEMARSPRVPRPRRGRVGRRPRSAPPLLCRRQTFAPGHCPMFWRRIHLFHCRHCGP